MASSCGCSTSSPPPESGLSAGSRTSGMITPGRNRKLIAPRGLLAQLMELTTYCSDCALPALLSTPFTSPTTTLPPMAHERFLPGSEREIFLIRERSDGLSRTNSEEARSKVEDFRHERLR